MTRSVSIALTRDVSPAIARCLLTFRPREPIDYARAVEQHEAYTRLLESLGCTVLRLPADVRLPDCCFVEDGAVVLDEIAVITRMGAPSRRGEAAAVAEALRPYRALVHLAPPARLDGGDVLVLGRRIFVGASRRTDERGLAAFAAAVAPHGYEVTVVPVSGSLHLKSAVTAVAEDVLVANPDWVDLHPFTGFEVIEVPEDEPSAANVLRVGATVVAAAGWPRTADRLRARGYDVRTVEVSEFVKAEAGVTCKSILFRTG
jgi:dimethylargininase